MKYKPLPITNMCLEKMGIVAVASTTELIEIHFVDEEQEAYWNIGVHISLIPRRILECLAVSEEKSCSLFYDEDPALFVEILKWAADHVRVQAQQIETFIQYNFEKINQQVTHD